MSPIRRFVGLVFRIVVCHYKTLVAHLSTRTPTRLLLSVVISHFHFFPHSFILLLAYVPAIATSYLTWFCMPTGTTRPVVAHRPIWCTAPLATGKVLFEAGAHTFGVVGHCCDALSHYKQCIRSLQISSELLQMQVRFFCKGNVHEGSAHKNML